MLLSSAAPPPSEHAAGVRCEVVELQAHKAGNHPHECEDNAQFDEADGIIALSDGAGEGIFSREWSRLLVDSFVAERPSLADAAWLERCRRAWFAQIDYAKLGWAHRTRVDKQGSGATLLTLRLYRAGPSHALAFRVEAVGDSCLFWVRGQQCQAFFPLAGSAAFPTQPELFSTHGQNLPALVQAGDWCEPGDRFVLATDAVSQWLFRMLESGQPFNWDRLCRMTLVDWEALLYALRKPCDAGDPSAPIPIENDDCTLLVVSVAPGADVV